MTNKIKKILILMLIPALLAGCSGAGDISLKIVEKSGYFSVGYDPLCYHTYEGYGLAVDIIRQAAQRMGVEAPIRPVNDYDWDVHLKNDDIDVMLCKTSSEHLQTDAVFTDGIVMLLGHSDAVQKVGVIDSDACIEQKNILSYQNGYDFSYYSDSRLLLNDLKEGLVDAAVMSEYDALSGAGANEYTLQVLSETPVFFSVSPEKQTFYAKLNAVLQQMSADGTTARLKSEYIQSLSQAD